MQSTSFKNFQVGIVDDPSNEQNGGFEFASGMDIFSEPGVIKANYQMSAISGSFGTSLPRFMVTNVNEAAAFIAIGDKVYRSTDGDTWSLFFTNGQGTVLGMAIFNAYLWYAAINQLGRCPVGDGTSHNDTYNALPAENNYHPMVQQGGTLKIGAGRYVSSVDEASLVTQQALKLPVGYVTKTLEDYFSRLFVGTTSTTNTDHEASVFEWQGTVLSSGSALPENPHPIKMRGMNVLATDGSYLYGFPDLLRNIYILDGAVFRELRKLYSDAFTATMASHGTVAQHLDTLLFSGNFTAGAGVFQMKGNAICQAFIPSVITPGATSSINIGFVKSAFNGRVLIGYLDNSGNTRLEISSTSGRQNNAFIRTLWHRLSTDRLKRFVGIKLNLKPLASGCSVAVSYRTSRDAAFTDSSYTITSSNQDKPVIFAAQPRAREIQFKLTYTVNGSTTPELLSYDPLYELLKSVR